MFFSLLSHNLGSIKLLLLELVYIPVGLAAPAITCTYLTTPIQANRIVTTHDAQAKYAGDISTAWGNPGPSLRNLP